MKFLVAVAFMGVLAVALATGWNDRGSDRGYGRRGDDHNRGSTLILVSRGNDHGDNNGWGRSSGRSYGNDGHNNGWNRGNDNNGYGRNDGHSARLVLVTRGDNNKGYGGDSYGRSSSYRSDNRGHGSSWGRSDNNGHGSSWGRSDNRRDNGYGKRW